MPWCRTVCWDDAVWNRQSKCQKNKHRDCNYPRNNKTSWNRVWHGGLTTRVSQRQPVTMDWKQCAHGGWLEPIVRRLVYHQTKSQVPEINHWWSNSRPRLSPSSQLNAAKTEQRLAAAQVYKPGIGDSVVHHRPDGIIARCHTSRVGDLVRRERDVRVLENSRCTPLMSQSKWGPSMDCQHPQCGAFEYRESATTRRARRTPRNACSL